MPNKDEIRIRPTYHHYEVNYPRHAWGGNVWLAVNPLPLPRNYHMDKATDRGSHIHRGVGVVVDPEVEQRWPDMPEWCDRLAGQLWEGVPTLKMLAIGNGHIVMHHTEAFTDDEIIEFATPIIEAVLKENALLIQSEGTTSNA